MRTLLVGMVGGLAALVGFAGAASADAVATLIWQSTGTNHIDPTTTQIIVLDVVITADSLGTVGGGISVDYGNFGDPNKLTVAGLCDGSPGSACVNNPDGTFLGGAPLPASDSGTQVNSLNGLNPFGPVAVNSSARIGQITFHKEATTGVAVLQTLYTATDTVDGVGNTGPGDFGTATVNTPEPGALSLLALGFGGLVLGRNRRS